MAEHKQREHNINNNNKQNQLLGKRLIGNKHYQLPPPPPLSLRQSLHRVDTLETYFDWFGFYEATNWSEALETNNKNYI